MAKDLKILEQNRKDILLAEVAAWLHDVGKFTSIHIEHHTNGHRRWGNARSYKVIVEDCTAVLHPVLCRQGDIGKRLCRALKHVLENTTPTFFSWLHNLNNSKARDWQSDVISFKVSVPGESWSIAQLILLGMPCAAKPPEIQYCFGRSGWLP